MNIFNEYAKYYDLLNLKKNYLEECNYIELIFNKFNVSPKSLLDYGCGTGKHSMELSKRGYETLGVDVSEKMIQIAKLNSRNIPHNLDLQINFETTESFLKKEVFFDTSISMFHVANYQTTDQDLNQFFNVLSKSTIKGGLIIFDYWFLPAVKFLKPQLRFREIENENLKISRISIPYIKKNIIEIEFKIFIENKQSKTITKLEEKHSMRPLSIQNIKDFLPKDLLLLDTFEWLTFDFPTQNSWNAVSILQKI